MRSISVSELKRFSAAALEKAGLSHENASGAAEVLVTTDTFGVLSHGTKNLFQYILKMKEGGLDAKAEPSIEREGPAWALMDGNAALGMITGRKAMELAVKKARKCGIAYVGVKNSCHFGAAGYYANIAAANGMIGLSMSNGDPVMAVPNARGVTIGNNPFAFAAPLRDGRSLFLDIALSNVAALKVIMAKEKGIRVPETWLVDENGAPTDDPTGFPGKASLQPMGAHKGYGFAMMVEILAAVLTGAGMLSQIVSWNLRLPEKNNAGHAFIAVDIAQMMDMDEFEDRLQQVVDELHGAPKAKGAERIFIPGEMEWDKRERALRDDRIEITDVMADNLKKLAELTDTDLKWPDQ